MSHALLISRRGRLHGDAPVTVPFPSHTMLEVPAEPLSLQYFVASLCDLRVDPEERRPLGLRYARTPEVQKLISKLQRSKFPQIPKTTDPNVVVSVLKEILSDFPGGVFRDEGEEFISIRPDSSLEIVLTYVNTLIQNLPCFLSQFTYLVCRCLRNLVFQTASTSTTTDSYTDMLLLFTPVLFPSSSADVSRFLRATRITLVLVDLCDTVFKPYLGVSWDPDDSDDDFFRHVVLNLTHLANWFDDSDLSSSGESTERTSDYGSLETLEEVPGLDPAAVRPNNDYYQFSFE
uniref:Rho-GAP domain-containing protein n=1 Tax=Steinernema glaseri TaxID=37863 RepID=A0A1I7ZW93_9BILA